MPPESAPNGQPTDPPALAARPSPFMELLARGLARGGWLLAQGLAGRPITSCTSSVCQWAHVEHYYGPGCPGCP